MASQIEILEGKTEYPYRSRMSKHFDEERCSFVLYMEALKQVKGGEAKIHRNKTKIHAQGLRLYPTTLLE